MLRCSFHWVDEAHPAMKARERVQFILIGADVIEMLLEPVTGRIM